MDNVFADQQRYLILTRKFSRMGNEELFKKLKSRTLNREEHQIAFAAAYLRFDRTDNLIKYVDRNHSSKQLLKAIKQLEYQLRMKTLLQELAIEDRDKRKNETQET